MKKGAFTGAVGQGIGRFEQAQGGTLFLDEIGDMPYHAQTRLLRTLQSGTISRIGGKASIRLDVRIIAATNQDLEALIAEGKFREDLYYRLNVVPVHLPPLRARPEDIGLLTRHFLNLAANEGLPTKQIDEDAISRLTQMQWRGNVREFKNFIYRLTLTAREDCISEATVMQIAGSGRRRTRDRWRPIAVLKRLSASSWQSSDSAGMAASGYIRARLPPLKSRYCMPSCSRRGGTSCRRQRCWASTGIRCAKSSTIMGWSAAR
jgi:DNA-binding NtrC family response regulator